jgi:hypothetical protein
MDRLRSKGVTFQEFETPNLKTENGVAEWDAGRGAWFEDSEGNILNIEQPSEEYKNLIRDFAAHAIS